MLAFINLILFSNTIIVYSQSNTWFRIWGLPGYNRGEEGKRVCQTYDGCNAVLCMVTRSNDTWFDLIKYDRFGNLLWANVIIDSIVTNRMLYDMHQTSDSGFILAGWLPAGQGALLVKTDKNGNLKWQRNYTNLNLGERFYSVQQTNDKGYIACGDYPDYASGTTKGLVTKVDSLGYIQWEKWYLDSTYNAFSEIIQGLDLNYYIAGGTSTNQPSTFYSILKKLDQLGNVITTKFYYFNGGGMFIIQLRDSSIIIGDQDITNNYPILAKFFPSGNLKWLKTYPIPYSNVFYFYNMSMDLFENIIMTGGYDKYTYSTILNWKLDTGGNVFKTKEVDYSGYYLIGSRCIKPTLDTGYILTGESLLNGNHDALTIKLDSAFNAPLLTKAIENYSSISNEFKILQNYPNPFNSSTSVKFYIPESGNVKIRIYDLDGREVLNLGNHFYIKGLNSFLLNTNQYSLSSGIYLFVVEYKDLTKSNKLVLIK